jgi:hypothetical protein
VLGAVALAGPGRLSVDHLLGTRLPRWTLVPGAALVGGLTWFAVRHSERVQAEMADRTPEPSVPTEPEAPVRLSAVGEPEPAAIGTDLPGTAGLAPEHDVEQPLGDDGIAAVRRADPGAG